MLLWLLNLEEAPPHVDNGWTDFSDPLVATWADFSSPSSSDWGDHSSAFALDWSNHADAEANRWIPFGKLLDASDGVDFLPKATFIAPYIATNDRPIAAINASTVTAAGFAGEGLP